MIFSNELKKGDIVFLRNGWKARIEDNKKGNTRLATVYGYETEMGSIYAHDIRYRKNEDGTIDLIELTKTQKDLYRMVEGDSAVGHRIKPDYENPEDSLDLFNKHY